MSGLVYWMFSGRLAGGGHGEPTQHTAAAANVAPIEAKPVAKPVASKPNGKPIEVTATDAKPDVKAAAKTSGSKA